MRSAAFSTLVAVVSEPTKGTAGSRSARAKSRVPLLALLADGDGVEQVWARPGDRLIADGPEVRDWDRFDGRFGEEERDLEARGATSSA
jgi:hypothetical protein